MTKIIKYTEKYNEFVNLYGEEEGEKKYFNFLRGGSLESYVLKFGEEEGLKRRNEYVEKAKNSGCSLEKMIKKYGEEEGKQRYKKWRLEVRSDKNSFIRRHGEEEGLIKFEEFKRKCGLSSDKIDYSKMLNPRKVNYWMVKFGFSEEEAKIKVSEFQNTQTLEKYIERYGEELGLFKYLETNKKKKPNLENYIRLFGEIEGPILYKLKNEKLKFAKSIDGYIQRYGEIDGPLKHKEHGQRRSNTLENLIKRHGEIKGTLKYEKMVSERYWITSKSYSKIALEFCESIFSEIKNIFNQIYFGENEYIFFIHSETIKIALPDFYIKDINFVIEFYGDYWHKNPKKFLFENNINQKIWEKDCLRINSIINKFNSSVIIIWENDYLSDKEGTIQFVISEIMKKRCEINGNN